jgi:hypothetical protein
VREVREEREEEGGRREAEKEERGKREEGRGKREEGRGKEKDTHKCKLLKSGLDPTKGPKHPPVSPVKTLNA